MILGASCASSARHQAPGRRDRDEAEIAARGGDGVDHVGGVVMRLVGDDEAEMEARDVPHRRVAERGVAMHGVGRLDMGEGRDDHPPDRFDDVDRQNAFVTADDLAHHRGFAPGAEGRAGSPARASPRSGDR